MKQVVCFGATFLMLAVLSGCEIRSHSHLELTIPFARVDSTSTNPNKIVIQEEMTNEDESIADDVIRIIGKIKEEESQVSVSSAKIRILGSDTEGNMGFSDEKGQFSILLPIGIKRNKETITLVIEIQKEGAINYPVAESGLSKEVMQWYNNPKEYKAAQLIELNISWKYLGREINVGNLPIRMKRND